jgi:hypothetical protein
MDRQRGEIETIGPHDKLSLFDPVDLTESSASALIAKLNDNPDVCMSRCPTPSTRRANSSTAEPAEKHTAHASHRFLGGEGSISDG